MPNKKLLIITALLVAGAIVVTFADQRGSNVPNDPRLGEKVWTGSTDKIDKIVLKKEYAQLELVKADGWYLGSAAGFPVDADKVLRFFDRLARVKLVRKVTDTEEDFAEFGLNAPTTLTVLNGDQQVLDLRLGKSRTGGGIYIAVGGEYKGYLADPDVTLALDEASWELRTLVDVAGDTVKRIEFQPVSGQPVVLARETKDADLKVVGLSESQSEIAGVATAQATILQDLKFSKRYDLSNEEGKAALSNPAVMLVETFAGRKLTVKTGDTGGATPKHFIRIDATGGDEVANQRLTRMMGGWQYEIPSFVADKFKKNLSTFVKADTAGSAPGGTPGKG